jgi:hypothetical protein
MTSRQFIRWTRLHDRRANKSSLLITLVAAIAFASFVYWRADDPISTSHAWLAGALVASGLAFMRVPFHLYWRADAAFLAQLPISGTALFDAALLRCFRAAAQTTFVMIAGALALFALDPAKVEWATRELQTTPIAGPPLPGLSVVDLVARHIGVAVVLGIVSAGLMPAVATWAATLVRQNIVSVATKLAGAPSLQTTTSMPGSASTTLLGALPGFVSTIVITLVIIAAPGMYNHEASLPPLTVMLGLAAFSIVAIVAMRAKSATVMGDILRDVSALDRQQLATLEIREPTALERTIARMLGEAGLPYRKDARLMRRRYPMAFALGALCFAVLVIVGLARPADPTPWLVVVIGGAALYAIALARRLYRPPIELLRLSATLPISSEARTRAKVAWVIAWAVVFVVVPSVFAALRLL